MRAVEPCAVAAVHVYAVPRADQDLENGHCENAEQDVLHHEAEQHLLEQVADAVAVTYD